MFHNSTKKHSFRKSGYKKEIHKKTEKFIKGNYRLWENPRFLIWLPFWLWMTFITSWDRVSHVFSILKDKSFPDQHSDTKLVAFNELWAILWSILLPPIPLFLNICVLQASDSLICGWSVWPGLTQNWPCPKMGARHFGKPQTLPYPSEVKNSIYMGGVIKTQTKHNYFIQISHQNLNFLEKNWHFDIYLTFNDPFILGFFTIIFVIEEKIEPDILVHHLLPSYL